MDTLMHELMGSPATEKSIFRFPRTCNYYTTAQHFVPLFIATTCNVQGSRWPLRFILSSQHFTWSSGCLNTWVCVPCTSPSLIACATAAENLARYKIRLRVLSPRYLPFRTYKLRIVSDACLAAACVAYLSMAHGGQAVKQSRILA